MRTGKALMLVLLVVIPAIPAWAIGIVNGDFSNDFITAPLPGDWVAVDGSVSWNIGKFAVLDESLGSWSSLMEQAFTIPVGATKLSFDYTLTRTPDNTSGGFPDLFTATLYDSSFVGLLPISTLNEYFRHETVAPPGSPIIDLSPWASIAGDRVTLDLASLSLPQSVTLAFELFGGDDGFTTRVTVDNVKMDVIPEPITAVGIPLALMSLGAYLRRRQVCRIA